MYLIKYLSNIETNTIVVAVAQPSELFDMCCVLEDSKHVIAWYIVGYKPSDFGWGFDNSYKLRSGSFTKGDFSKY